MDERKKARLMEEQERAAAEEAKRSETARIQVRLPDGSSMTHNFPSTEPLQNLYDQVVQHIGGPVKLSTTFPKRQFTGEDMSRTFADLQLAPSAVVIAVPDRGSRGSNSAVVSGGIFTMLLAPLIQLWNFIYTFLFGRPESVDNRQQQSTPSASSASSTPSRPERPSTAYKRRTPNRPDGNVRRIHDMQDSDEDMTTYNGNSTQQL